MGLDAELRRQLDSLDRAVERGKAEQLELQARLRAIKSGSQTQAESAPVRVRREATEEQSMGVTKQVRDQLSDLEARRAVLAAMRSDHAQLAQRSCVRLGRDSDVS